MNDWQSAVLLMEAAVERHFLPLHQFFQRTDTYNKFDQVEHGLSLEQTRTKEHSDFAVMLRCLFIKAAEEGVCRVY